MRQLSNRQQSSRGFTLVELMLAMAFLSMMLIVIAVTVMQIINIYNKGITIKEINQIGRAISVDMKRAIGEGASFSLDSSSKNFCLLNPSRGCINDPRVAVGGRLCTGSYTYAWSFRDKSVDGQNGLLRVNDPDGKYCKQSSSSSSLPLINATADATQILSANSNVKILDFAVVRMNTGYVSDDEAVYKISIQVGPYDSEDISYDPGSRVYSCKPAANAFCAVNYFDITAFAGNNRGGI